MNGRDLRIINSFRKMINNNNDPLFYTNKTVESYKQAQEIAESYNKLPSNIRKQFLSPGDLYASSLLHNFYQIMIDRYLIDQDSSYFSRFVRTSETQSDCKNLLTFYRENYPTFNPDVLNSIEIVKKEEDARGFFLLCVMLDNKALLNSIKPLLKDTKLKFPSSFNSVAMLVGAYKTDKDTLFDLLSKPARLYPDSLEKQIEYILDAWKEFLPESLYIMLCKGLSTLKEEHRERFVGPFVPGQDLELEDYSQSYKEYEAFTTDRDWMPNVVMMAKSTLVWLDQLSKKYKKNITRLDQIPDQELDDLKERGFTSLWLIGLWQRSYASKRIKHLCGNSEAEASAYSLYNNEISDQIGGWDSLNDLKRRCDQRNIKLASDMVPNHCGIDSQWVHQHPEYFISQDWPPFPSYTYNGEDLSTDPNIEIKLEDHYYDQTDAAVSFRRIDKTTGETKYIFHGNDGTSMPWNDTAQLDYLRKDTREAVINEIFRVASNFQVIRFDAAMTLAKKHIQRLWYPKLGVGAEISGRSQYALSQKDFDRLLPVEFWRDVVDRINNQMPDTLLLAEAFWMMESYFVRTLGMHRVYNSAFMHMMKNQDNKKYREGMKNTLKFDPEILKRYVNFMNNPDEETAITQFGDGDKYFGVCTLLSTLPGLPMYGHGQIEGFYEKYGMEFSKACWNEVPNQNLIEAHYKKIFPLLKQRYLFSGVKYFELFDVCNENKVCEDIYCFVNGNEKTKVLVCYNNSFEKSEGYATNSCPKLHRLDNDQRVVKTKSLADALDLNLGGNRYVIYKNFNTNLYHIASSMKIFDEGLKISLDGYQTSIFLDIHEVQDYDGTYSLLYQRLQNKGVKDLNQELQLLRLEPLAIASENFFTSKMLDLLKDILTKNVNKKDCNKYLLLCGEAYAKMSSVCSNTDIEALKDFNIVSLDKLKTFITRLNSLNQDTKHLSNISKIMKEYIILIHLSYFIRPFIKRDDTLKSMMLKINNLHLDKLFYDSLIFIEPNVDKHKNIVNKIPFILYDFKLNGCKTSKGKLNKLLKDEYIQEYINVHSYENKIYYNQERLHDVLSLVIINLINRSRSESNKELEKIYLQWMETESEANYLFTNLV